MYASIAPSLLPTPKGFAQKSFQPSASIPDHPDRAFGTASPPLQGGESPDSKCIHVNKLGRSDSPPCKGGEAAQSAVGVVRIRAFWVLCANPSIAMEGS